jgi:hypothetical protein
MKPLAPRTTPTMAVLQTGFLRRADETRDAMAEHLIGPSNGTLFVATWDILDNEKLAIGEFRVDPRTVSPRTVLELYGDGVADCSVRSYTMYERSVPQIERRQRPDDVLDVNPSARLHNTTYMNRIFAQWYIVRDGLRMIEEHERLHGMRFDFICRTRSDLLFHDVLPDWPRDRVLVSSDLIPGMPTDRSWFPDFFAVGPRDEMMKFSELCFSIEALYDRQNVDTSHAENLMLQHMVRADIPLVALHVPFTRI